MESQQYRNASYAWLKQHYGDCRNPMAYWSEGSDLKPDPTYLVELRGMTNAEACSSVFEHLKAYPTHKEKYAKDEPTRQLVDQYIGLYQRAADALEGKSEIKREGRTPREIAEDLLQIAEAAIKEANALTTPWMPPLSYSWYKCERLRRR